MKHAYRMVVLDPPWDAEEWRALLEGLGLRGAEEDDP